MNWRWFSFVPKFGYQLTVVILMGGLSFTCLHLDALKRFVSWDIYQRKHLGQRDIVFVEDATCYPHCDCGY